MRVKIGNYKNYFGPYQLAELLCFWARKDSGEDFPDWVDRFGDWLALTWLAEFLDWVDSVRSRTVKVHIDRWDTYSMDHTLALIVLPMLRQLQATKQGAPCVDLKDVPQELVPDCISRLENAADSVVDSTHFERWEWVLSEMIFAFEHKVNTDWEDQPCRSEVEQTEARVKQGLCLFGKYYNNLWD